MQHSSDQRDLVDCLRLATRLGSNARDRLALLRSLVASDIATVAQSESEIESSDRTAERERPEHRGTGSIEARELKPRPSETADRPDRGTTQEQNDALTNRLRALSDRLFATQRKYREQTYEPRDSRAGGRRLRFPVFLPLVAENDVAALAAAISTHRHSTCRIDIRRLQRAVEQRRLPAVVPYVKKKGLGTCLHIWIDTGIGMLPFARDQQALANALAALIGNVRCVISMFDPSRRLDSPMSDKGNSLIASLEPGSTLLVLTDLHRFGRQFSYGHTESSEWLALEKQLLVNRITALFLVPGAPDGNVPRPTHPQFFSGREPRIGRIVPWDNGITPHHARQYATGARSIRFLDMAYAIDSPDAIKAGRIRPASRKLFALLATLASDLDPFTLRTLRLALARPRDLCRKIMNKNGAELIALEPSAAALDEYAVWISDAVERRGEVSSLRASIEDSDPLRTLGLAHLHDSADFDAIQRVLEVCREALLRQRAQRGFDAQHGDDVRWTSLQLRIETSMMDSPGSSRAEELTARYADLREIQAMATALRSGKEVESSRKYAIEIARRDNQIRIAYEGELPREWIIYRLGLPAGRSLANIDIEGWTSGDAESPPKRFAATQNRSWRTIPALDPETLVPVQVIVLNVDGTPHAINIDASREQPQPLFRMKLSKLKLAKVSELRFDGDHLIVNDRLFDPIGFADMGAALPATPVAKPEMIIPQGAQSLDVGDPASGWQLEYPSKDGCIAFVQLDPALPDITAFDLPARNASGRISISAVQKGHTALARDDHLWWIGQKENALNISVWESPSLSENNDFFAAAEVGVLLAKRRDEGTDLHFLPSAPDAQEKFISVHADLDARKCAISDKGLIAIAGAGELWILQSLDTLHQHASGTRNEMNKAASTPSSALPLNVGAPRRYRRHALQGPDFFKASALEAVLSADADTTWRLNKALKHWKVELTLADVQSIAEVAQAAPLVVATWNGDTDALFDMRPALDVNTFRLPGSGLGLLHIAASRNHPTKLLQRLVELGCDVNMTDRFGQTVLYLAAFAQDSLEAVATLLDLGADPALTAEREGMPIGPLPVVAWYLDFRKPRHEEIFERMLRAGASPLAFSSANHSNLLIGAAASPDPAVMRTCLKLDPRVDHVAKDGFTPLTVAAWFGHVEHVQQLLEAGASVDLRAPKGQRALLHAIGVGEVESVQALLQAGASPNALYPDEEPPLARLLTARMRPEPGADLVPIDSARRQAIAEHLAGAGAIVDAMEGFYDFPLQPLLDDGKSRAWALDTAQDIVHGFANAHCRAPVVALALHTIERETGARNILQLLDYPIDFDAAGRSGLRLVHLLSGWPALDNKRNVLDELVEKGVNLSAVDEYGATALHYAAAAGNTRMVSELLRRAPGLERMARQDGTLPGDIAAFFGHEKLARKLGITGGRDSHAATSRKKPTTSDYARLQFLPKQTQWTQLPLPTALRTKYSAEKLPWPLPSRLSGIKLWSPVECRRAPLDIDADRWIEETWWRAEDDLCGVSGRVTDGSGNVLIPELTGSSWPIHKLNGKRTPTLNTPEDAMRYLKFFTHAVHGEHGAFAVCESDEIMRAHIPPSLQEKADTLKSAFTVKKGNDGLWTIDIQVRYSWALFQATFQIQPSGMIEMLEDTPVLAWENARDDRIFGSESGIYFYAPVT